MRGRACVRGRGDSSAPARGRAPYPPTHPPPLHTGATGLVGSRLASRLAASGRDVRVLTRDVASAKGKLALPRTRFYAPADWASAIAGAGGVVNLAGEPIASRWSPALKAEIRRSRLATTAAVVDAIAATPEAQRPPVLVSASAVGFYSPSQTQTFTEASAPGSDFLAQLCVDWEAAANGAARAGVRVATIRAGIVLAREGGALGRMLPAFSAFAGGPLGTGRQWCSWIHRDDLVALYVEALSNPSYAGPYNGTAPAPARMADLCAALGGVLGRPSWLPVPDFALQVRERGGEGGERGGDWWKRGVWLPATPAASPTNAVCSGRARWHSWLW